MLIHSNWHNRKTLIWVPFLTNSFTASLLTMRKYCKKWNNWFSFREYYIYCNPYWNVKEFIVIL